MNTTFTNYAEKKAKQFFNLLQGYTKGIRMTAILILLLMGVSIPTNAGVFLAGSMNDWSTNANELKSVATDTWRSDIYLEANTTYTFKIVYNGYWCGNGGTITSTITNWGFTWDGGNDCTIKTTLAGPYTFKWVGNGNKLSVTYPTSKTYTVTVPEGTPDCYICGDMTKWEFRQMTKENNTEYKITINSTNTAEYKYACASSWGFQELNGNCNGTISNRTYNANDNVLCWSLKTIYFKPNSDWEQANARFEVNWWIDGESHSGWVDLVQTECDDYYVAQVPLYKAKVKFYRTNPNDFNNKWNIIDNQTVPTDDNNLFTVTGWESGSWSSSSRTITTNAGANGNITVSPGKTVNIGETVTVTITPDNNYKIKSYTIGSSTTNVSETGAKSFNLTICSNTEISAEFETTKSKYTVSFNMNGHGDAIAAQEIAEGEKVAKPTDPTATGYTFGGWYKDANCTNAWNFNTDVVTGNMTLYAKWTATEYTITYNNLYGVIHSNPTTYTIESETITFTNPTSERTGYTFKGWNPTRITKGSTGNKTVTAQWTIKNYDITYTQPTNGSYTIKVGNGAAVTTNTTADYNTTITLANNPATGYHFSQWNITPEIEITNNTFSMPANDVTIGVTFALNTYSVKFNANGGTGQMADQSFDYNERKALSTNNFTREGYAFLGWSTTPDGEVVYGDEANVTNLTTTNNATVNLYAQWLSQTPTYTINFDKQNGTNGTSSATVQYQNNNYSVNPVVAPTRTDYTFGGYYTQAEGAGVQVVSAAGEWLKSVTGYTDASGNWIKNSNVTTLYAKWISNSTSTEGLPTDVYLVGSFGRWDLNDDKQQFKKATADATIYTLTWTFDAAKTYEFKVSVAGEFRGLDNNNEITVEKTSLTIPSTGNNCKITTTEAGEYIFTWDSETNILSVEYPSDRVTVTFFGDGGTVGAVADDRVLTSPAKVKPGTSVTFTATPDANNAFSQWKKNGVVVSTDLTYTCTIDADATIEAVFLKPTTVFLKPHDEWKFNNARFAIYYWNNNGNGWVDLEQLTCDDEYYTADVPVGYSDIKFVRLNPANKDHNFNDGTCWNQTTDLTLPTNGNNLYDLTKIYLKPNANWKIDGARFAAYFFHSDYDDDKAWMSMLNTDENGVYYCDVPTDKLYNKVSFVRMKGDQSTNDWDNRWNQSKDIDLYNGSNFYTLEEGKWGKGSDGRDIDDMNVIYSGKWTKLELPTITITNTTPDFGDVIVKTTGGRIITNGEKVPFDTKVIVTVTPKNGYTCKTATIDGASLSEDTPYTICHNTPINVTFAIKEEWYVIGVDGDWETPQERFRFVDGQLEVELDTNITANFKIAYMRGTEILDRYGNQSFSITERDKILTLANGSGDHCNIATTYYGKYLFTWDAGKMKLTITYPLSVGDYRLAYQDTQDNTLHVERVIKKCFTGDRLDTVSFFVRHNKQPKLVLQQCATLVDGVGTWQTIDDNIEFSVGSTRVWNFVLQQTNNPTHSVQVLTDDIKPYEGDYYIRTKSAKDGWTYFRSDSHKMTYSSYADNNQPFSHYFCKWVATDAEAANKTKNVRYTIANDYGDCISDTLAADPEDANPQIVTNANGDLPTNSANVRFGWDWETNEIRRAYLTGSTGDSENTYLRLADGVELKDASNVSQTAIRFNDMENWIYQLDVIATKSTKVNLTALYNGSLQYFKGGPTMTNEQDDRIGLLSDDASSDITFNIRLVYDFKTNHLIVAWVPNNNGTYDGVLGANMMVIREHDYKNGNGTVAVTQLNLQNDGLTNVDTVYAVMTFTQNWINKTPETRDQSIYWVSFPFDVKLSDAFGFGEYADAWIIQYYDGAARAEKGLFSDSGTYWKYIFNPDGVVLKKGVGYVLVLDLDKIQFNHGVTSVSLYFPSSGEVGTITRDISATVTVPAHKCEITTGSINHTITDSHWNLIGVPAFKDVTEFNTDKTLAPVYQQDSVSFYYEFLPNKSTYRANNNVTDFKAMYSYMVQFAGTINWNTKEATKPAQLAARRNSESELPEKISFRLEITQDDVMADQTFVQLQQEGATAEFDMNLDLTKIINSGANIYTLAGEQRIQSAGNALPMDETVVPVGVQIAAEGEYTFRMPDGTEGMVVELIDYEAGTTTNLLLSDYIVTLQKGTEENRFALHIQPEKDVTTGVGNVGDEAKGIEKYLIDGKLIIRTAEGAVYDAQGHVVQ